MVTAVFTLLKKKNTKYNTIGNVRQNESQSPFTHFINCGHHNFFLLFTVSSTVQHMLNLNKNDCTSQKFTRKKLTWKTFVTHSSESGAVRALCTAAHLQKLWNVGPTPYITDWFKVLTTRLRVLRPAQKRTPVTPNHCQLSTAVIESVLRLQTIVFFSFHENLSCCQTWTL